jgi:hypothetical protein
MKIKALVESILAGVVSAILSYGALSLPATLAALALRRKMPEAWFSSSVVGYAHFVVVGISITIAAVACRMVYKHASTPRA